MNDVGAYSLQMRGPEADGLFQELVGATAKGFRNAGQAVERDVVSTALHAADERPVHVRSLRQLFLRPFEPLAKPADILSEHLAVRVCHAPQVWREMPSANIDYATISRI